MAAKCHEDNTIAKKIYVRLCTVWVCDKEH